VSTQIAPRFDEGIFKEIRSLFESSWASARSELDSFKAVHDKSTAELQSKMESVAAIHDAVGTEMESQRAQLSKIRTMLESDSFSSKRKDHILSIGLQATRQSQYGEWKRLMDDVAKWHQTVSADDRTVSLRDSTLAKIKKGLMKFGTLKYRGGPDGGHKAFETPAESKTNSEVVPGRSTKGPGESLRREQTMESKDVVSRELMVAKETKLKELRGLNETLRIRKGDLEKLVATKSAMIRSMAATERSLKRRAEDLEHQMEALQRTVDAQRADIERQEQGTAKLKGAVLKLSQALGAEKAQYEMSREQWARQEAERVRSISIMQSQMAEMEHSHLKDREKLIGALRAQKETESKLREEMKESGHFVGVGRKDSGRASGWNHVTSKAMSYNGRNHKDYVEDFCRIGNYGNPKITTAFCSQRGWKCTMEIEGVGLKHTESCKQKKGAINQCYQKLALHIQNGSV